MSQIGTYKGHFEGTKANWNDSVIKPYMSLYTVCLYEQSRGNSMASNIATFSRFFFFKFLLME